MEMDMTSLRPSLLILAAAMVIALTAVFAQASDVGGDPTGAKTTVSSDAAAPGASLSPRDRKLVADMARAGIAEVEAGKLAVAKASDLAVKQFGERMVEEHSKANRELGKIAVEKDVALPTEADAAQRAEIAELAKLSGVEFDRRYIRIAAREDHPEAQRLFEEAATTAKDPEVRKFAEGQMKVIGHHIELARSVGHSAGNLAPSRDEGEPFREPRAGTEG
jgi:putative membrane protein